MEHVDLAAFQLYLLFEGAVVDGRQQCVAQLLEGAHIDGLQSSPPFRRRRSGSEVLLLLLLLLERKRRRCFGGLHFQWRDEEEKEKEVRDFILSQWSRPHLIAY
jgi:hypothetical protein